MADAHARWAKIGRPLQSTPAGALLVIFLAGVPYGSTGKSTGAHRPMSAYQVRYRALKDGLYGSFRSPQRNDHG